jgi:hypothetical protein
MKPDFLNVDLEIWSASKLDGLLAEMRERVSVRHCGPAPKRHLLAVANSRYYKNPDSAIHALCKVVESLSAAGCRTWSASRKTFDVGYSLRPSERSSHFSLRPDTLARVSGLGASLAVTYYRGDTHDAYTSVEPTPVTPVSFRFGFPAGGSHRRRGSVLGR